MCLSPINILLPHTRVNGSRTAAVPCGKCLECVSDYQNSWAQRMAEEFIQKHYKGCFLTLTYRDDKAPVVKYDPDLPDDLQHPYILETGDITGKDDLAQPYYDDYGNLRYPDSRWYTFEKKHFVNWIKRLRENLALKHDGTRQDFSYFLTSEYGPKTFRCHAHILLFGLSCEDISFAIEDWENRFGHVDFDNIRLDPDHKDIFGNLKPHTPGKIIWYVSKYVSKGIFDNPRIRRFDRKSNSYVGIVEPCFHLISKHFGEGYINRRVDQILPVLRSLLPPKYGESSFPYVRNEDITIAEMQSYKPLLHKPLSKASLNLIKNTKRVFESREMVIIPYYNRSGLNESYILFPFLGFTRCWDVSPENKSSFIYTLYEYLKYQFSEFVGGEKTKDFKYPLARYFSDRIIFQISKKLNLYPYELFSALSLFKEKMSNYLFTAEYNKFIQSGFFESDCKTASALFRYKARIVAAREKRIKTNLRNFYQKSVL